MEPSSEVPMFVDVDRGSDYSELDKQSILASILKQPMKSEAVGPQQTAVENESQSQESPAQSQKTQQKPRIKCPECQRYTTNCEEKMLRHIRKMHRGENPFQCTMCDYSTYNKSLFEEHVRIHKGIKPFQCAYCPYRSASKKNKNKHELIHRKNNPLRCDLCPFIAHHYRSLECHKQKHENGQIKVKMEEKEENISNLTCGVCSYKFSSSIAFQRHKSNHSSSICEECGDKFCSPYYLRKHMACAHGAKKETFRCQSCGWIGAVRVKILLHLIHHPQAADEAQVDVAVLKKHGIIT